jgi:hypothetical protein
MARLLASLVACHLAVVRAVVVSVMMPVVVMVMTVMPRGVVGTVTRLGDARSADHHGAGGAEQCDCA